MRDGEQGFVGFAVVDDYGQLQFNREFELRPENVFLHLACRAGKLRVRIVINEIEADLANGTRSGMQRQFSHRVNCWSGVAA